jgi:hypothetical protein
VSESAPAAAAASAPTAPARSAAEEHAHAVGRLRRSSLGQIMLLLVETALGMIVAMYVSVPDADQGKGLMASFGDSIAKGPAGIAVHAILGMLVFINACVLVVFALTVRSNAAKICSVIGGLCIAGAAMSGAAFLNAAHHTGRSAALTMGLLTLVAIACYAVNLFVLNNGDGDAATD